MWVLGALVILEIADGIITNILIKLDIAHEGNPLLTSIAGDSGLLIVKIVGVTLVAVILWDIYRRHPRLALGVSSVFLAVNIGIVAWNLNLLITGINLV